MEQGKITLNSLREFRGIGYGILCCRREVCRTKYIFHDQSGLVVFCLRIVPLLFLFLSEVWSEEEVVFKRFHVLVESLCTLLDVGSASEKFVA
jgi:hypothetical protein